MRQNKLKEIEARLAQVEQWQQTNLCMAMLRDFDKALHSISNQKFIYANEFNESWFSGRLYLMNEIFKSWDAIRAKYGLKTN